MQKLWIFILIVFCTSSMGCWGRSDVRKIGIVAAIGVDKAADGFSISIQLLDPKSNDETSEKQVPFNVFHVTGTTFSEALHKLALQSPRKLYFANTKLIIMGEELAKEGINPVLDFLLRNYQMRISQSLVIAKNTTAQKVLAILTPIESNPETYITGILAFSPTSWGQDVNVQLDQLVNSINSEGTNAVLSGIGIAGNPGAQTNLNSLKQTQSPALLELDSLAVFRNDCLIGWLNSEESKGYNYIAGNIKNSIENIVYAPPQALSLLVKETHSRVKSRIVHSQPMIDLNLNVGGDISDTQSNLDISKQKNIKTLEKLFAAAVKGHLQAALNKALKQYHTDIFGFGEVIHQEHPRYWKGLKGKWKNQLPDIPVRVRVTVKIMDIGVITKPLIH